MRYASNSTNFGSYNEICPQKSHRNISHAEIELNTSTYKKSSGQKFAKFFAFYDKINCKNSRYDPNYDINQNHFIGINVYMDFFNKCKERIVIQVKPTKTHKR